MCVCVCALILYGLKYTYMSILRTKCINDSVFGMTCNNDGVFGMTLTQLSYLCHLLLTQRNLKWCHIL